MNIKLKIKTNPVKHSGLIIIIIKPQDICKEKKLIFILVILENTLNLR